MTVRLKVTYKIHLILGIVAAFFRMRRSARTGDADNIALIQCQTKTNDILISHTFSFNSILDVADVLFLLNITCPRQ